MISHFRLPAARAGLFIGLFWLVVQACSPSEPVFAFIPQSVDHFLHLAAPYVDLVEGLPPEQRAALERLDALTGPFSTSELWLFPFPAGEGKETFLILVPEPEAEPWAPYLDSLLQGARQSYDYRGVRLFSLPVGWVAQVGGMLLLAEYPYALEDALAQWTDGKPRPAWRGLQPFRPGTRSMSLWFDDSGWKGWAVGPSLALSAEKGVLSARLDSSGGLYQLSGILEGDFSGRLQKTAALRPFLDATPKSSDWLVASGIDLSGLASSALPEAARRALAPVGALAGFQPYAESGTTSVTVGVFRLETQVDWAGTLTEEPPVRYQLFDLYELASSAVPAAVWPEAFARDGSVWMAQADRFVFFSQNRQGLQRWLDYYLTGQVWGQDEALLALLPRSPAEADAWLVLRPSADLLPPWQGMDLAFLQVRNGRLSGTGLADGRAVKSGFWELAWQQSLDAPVHWGPYTSKQGGQQLLWMQDATNRLYALDGQSGAVVWTQALPRRLLPGLALLRGSLSAPYHLAVCSPGQLYLLDSDGRTVPPFPLLMEEEATTGPVLFPDGSLSGDAVLVPAANGGIYGYAQNGSPLPGWGPRWGVGAVRQRPVVLRYRQNTYIAVQTEEGWLQLLDREGRLHFPPDSLSGAGHAPIGWQLLPEGARLVINEAEGRVRIRNLQGQGFFLRLAQQGEIDFLFADLLGDDRKDYLSTQNDRIRLHAYRGTSFGLQASGELPFRPDTIFELALPEGKSRVGLWNRSDRKALILDSSLQARPEFQLSADRPLISLGHSGTYLVVTTLEEKVYAFRPDASQ